MWVINTDDQFQMKWSLDLTLQGFLSKHDFDHENYFLHIIYTLNVQIVHFIELYVHTTVQKFGISTLFSFNEINPFIEQGGIKLIKNKEMYNVTNDLKKMKNYKNKK